MKRKEFIQLGTIVTASTLISFTIKEQLNKSDSDNIKREDYNLFSEPILKAIAMGLNAPSAHNTQPWKFKIINETSALLYSDENKLLLATDPLTRQIHISGGCFLEALTIGCSGIGYKAIIELLVDEKYTNEKIGKMPIAQINLKEDKQISKHLLWDYIFKRRMNRTPYEGQLITNEEFSKIKMDFNGSHTKLIFINEKSKMEAYSIIFKAAMEVESKTLLTNEETRKMFRFSDTEASQSRDGITFDGNGLTGIRKLFAQLFTNNTTESWNSPNIVRKGLEKFNTCIDSSKGFIILLTEKNDFKSQILSGKDLFEFCLALTKNGLYMHPLNQANEEFKEMENLSNQLDNLVGIHDHQKIQIIARIGRAEIPYQSFRRQLTDFIIKK